MQERRKITRTRVFKGAKLLLGKLSVIDCVVRNITSAGAGVELPNALDLPETLDVTFDGSHSFRRCRCVWRKLTRIGVEFI
jgi:PilZ domain